MSMKSGIPKSQFQSIVRESNSLDAPDSDIRNEFNRLVDEWKTGRRRGADVAQMTAHPAYQQIVGMGERAIPLILEELERQADHWFPALHELTGTSPVPEESKGNLAKMRQAWLDWGKTRHTFIEWQLD